MRIQIIKIGKPTHRAYEDLAALYAKRLKPVWKIEEHFLRAQPHEERAGKEIFKRLGWEEGVGQRSDSSHYIVSLDERGQTFTSPAFARFLQQTMELGHVKRMSIVLGGPFGISPEVRERSDLLWSLSPAVFPSDLAWVIVWEQLYRASSILRGSSYHHDGE